LNRTLTELTSGECGAKAGTALVAPTTAIVFSGRLRACSWLINLGEFRMLFWRFSVKDFKN